MKKILYLIVTIFMFSLLGSRVYASSFSLSLSGDESFNDEVSIDVIVNNLNGFTNGFYGLDATLSYDKSKIELKEITTNASYTLTYDKTVSDRFVVVTGNGVNNGTTIATLTFKNKGLSAGDSVTVSLTNMIGSTGEEDVIIGGSVSKTLTLGNETYLKGDMNKDGEIGLQDVIMILRRYLNVDESTSEDIKIGDMNNDGVIGLQDVITILRKYLGVE